MRRHENYRELIWVLAKTDFKLRYHDSALGYVWALLKPLLMFTILNFVFSSLFNPRGTGVGTYSLELLTAIVLFNFFSEGSTAGMHSLLNKSQLVTKIYLPRWTLILASTLNAAMIFGMNLLVVVAFYAYKGFLPSLGGVTLFALFIALTYALVLAFALLTAPLYAKYRDLAMIWEVALQALFFATPIVYSLQLMPTYIQQVLLLNPMAFIIHFTKEGLISAHYPEPWQLLAFIGAIGAVFAVSVASYRKFAPRVAEEL